MNRLNNIIFYSLLFIVFYSASLQAQSIENDTLLEDKYISKYYDLYDSIGMKKSLSFYSKSFDSKHFFYHTTNEQYAKKVALKMMIFKEINKRLKEDSTINSIDFMFLKMKTDDIKTYKEYIENRWKPSYKNKWELKNNDSILRLVVDDLHINRMGITEQNKYEEKLEMIKKDSIYKTLIVSETENFKSKLIKVNENNVTEEILTELPYEETNKVDIEIPFNNLNKAPNIIDCQGKSKSENFKCVKRFISKHVSKEFNFENISIAQMQGVSNRHKINVKFNIDYNGIVTDIYALANNPSFEKEAKRVIKLLPKFIPGEYNGFSVITSYQLPIIFSL